MVSSSAATVGIISIGDMGVGIARILIAHNFRVITNASDRSQATQTRATKNNIELVATDVDLCNQSDYIFSIVPPRDALATAHRIATASHHKDWDRQPPRHPLYFCDLNAISPKSSREIAEIISNATTTATTPTPNIRFVDGGIIGGPPRLKDDGTWYRPSIPTSGPHSISTAPIAGAELASALGLTTTSHINAEIGAATGLKMCFASLSKGYTALAIQAFTTARNLGCLDELRSQMAQHNPNGLKAAEGGLPAMCPKAYRWVAEMREIAETFEADGGFAEAESVFRPIAELYGFVAEGTELGREVTEDRKIGRTAREVAEVMGESTRRRKEKTE